MEGGRADDGGKAGAAAGGQERRRRWRGAGCGDDEEESSDGSSGVELSLRLRTGAADDDDDGTACATPPLPPPAEARRRNMTIFYNGRVCAADVTEVQARAIISMASEETLALAADQRGQRQQLMRGDGYDDGRRRLQDGDGDGDRSSSSSSSAAVARRCARDRGLVVRPSVAPSLLAAGGGVGCPRQGAVAAPLLEIDPAAAAGLSMKRSLQLFLQKRKARTAAAVAPPYAGGGRQAQAVRR